ncbi:MAG: serine hydrolase [Alphaproteobacteria bacterium]
MARDNNDNTMTRRGFVELGVKSLTAMALLPLFPQAAEAKASKPEEPLKGGSAFIIGHEDFLDDTHLPENQKINRELDTPFYTASLVKLITVAAVLRKIDEDREAVARGDMIEGDALTMDSVLTISSRAHRRSSRRSNQEKMTVREALTMTGSFSLNDATYALAERVGAGKPITDALTGRQSMDYVKKFIGEHMRTLVSDLGMNNTRIYTPTGIPDYEGGGRSKLSPRNDQSTQRDFMKLMNYLVQNHEENLDVFSKPSMYTKAEAEDGSLYTVQYKNSVPLLHNSARADAIATKGVIGGKTGFHDFSLLQSVCIFDLSEIGGQGHMVIMSLGNDNDTYATEPQRVKDTAVALAKQELTLELANEEQALLMD